MSQPSISVIIPIFNMMDYLPECLDSVLHQTLKDLEIICINDGSTDNSQNVLDEYSSEDKRIKVITQDNQGVAVARNNGIDMAQGEFLYFIDPDDWLPDDKVLEDLYTTAKEKNALVCGGSVIYSTPYGIVDKWEDADIKNTFEEDGFVEYSDYQYDFGWVRYIYNREFLNSHSFRIPQLTFYEDPVFFVEVLNEAKKFYAMQRCTYCYRTGHKELVMSAQKVADLLKGIYSVVCLAKQEHYIDLIRLEKKRIENDFAEHIYPHLLDEGPSQIKSLMEKINYQFNEGNDRIEYKLCENVFRTRSTAAQRAAQSEIEEAVRNARLEAQCETEEAVRNARLEAQREMEEAVRNARLEAQRETEEAVQNARLEEQHYAEQKIQKVLLDEQQKSQAAANEAAKKAEQQTIDMVHRSTTWKVGNAALLIPKTIKSAFIKQEEE